MLKLRIPEYIGAINVFVVGVTYFILTHLENMGVSVFIITLISVAVAFTLLAAPFYVGIEIGESFISMNVPPFGGKLVRIDNIESTRKINLKDEEEREWLPETRLFGISIWKYKSGWFKLKNGKMGLLLLNSDDAIIIDTGGLIVITSVQGKERLLNLKN